MKKGISKLWVEKYRPQILDDIIFQDEAQKNISKTKLKKKIFQTYYFQVCKDQEKLLYPKLL